MGSEVENSRNGLVTARNAISEQLKGDYAVLVSWRKVARKYGISSAMAWRVARGYIPKDNQIRVKLGFPEIITQEVWRNSKGRFKEG